MTKIDLKWQDIASDADMIRTKRFTEKEIKDIDPRYLAFAVKVDEVEG